ncbi:MAG: hypothetical protein IJW71_01675 [Clostridia bacterium]|nr:hypothetical protein [Clostridia bacterium]
MKYILMSDGIAAVYDRGGCPSEQVRRICFSEPIEGRLTLDGKESLPVKAGVVTLPRVLCDGVYRPTLYSHRPTAAQWRLESLRVRDGRVTPMGIDATALLIKLYEENRKNRQAIEKLTRDALYFKSKIDGGSLF